MTSYPILYSFRRCPYAMRARMALVYAGIVCELREVKLRDKPPQLLETSPKGTVPVLCLPEGGVIDESLEIMDYAISQHDPDGWGAGDDPQQAEGKALVTRNDTVFAPLLTRYKYHTRYTEKTQEAYRSQLEQEHLQPLEERLQAHAYTLGEGKTLTDVALFPLIRQCAMVEPEWFAQSPYTQLRRWLNGFLDSNDFARAMPKYQPWQAGDAITLFPAD